ncbi:MAG: hypothetical protein OEZ36_04930 [Spirochaetota bacterium]|nr:hypothetical protein [Spirochaetota bacterium]
MPEHISLNTLIEQIKNYPFLCDRWNHFYRDARSFVEDNLSQHTLFLDRLVVEGESNLELHFHRGFMDLSELNLESWQDDLFYIIKLCLTGKNYLSQELKSSIHEILLEFTLDDRVHTIHVTLKKPISAEIYCCSIERLRESDDPKHHVVAEGANLKEIQDKFKHFFSDMLDLPFLKNGTYHNGQYFDHPITFATYFSFLFLDSNRPYKIFSEEQSSFWRKRAFQVLLGLKGIPSISFFQTALAENRFRELLLHKVKRDILKSISSLGKENHRDWHKRLLVLSERIDKLEDLKLAFAQSLEESYFLDVEKKIDTVIKDLQSKLHQHQQKEILILQDIHNLGGQFEPKKKSKKQTSHHPSDENQFSLFLTEDQHGNNNKEKIDQLIGDYYINLSQIEVLEADIEELGEKKQLELHNIKEKEKNNTEKLNKDIIELEREMNNIIGQNSEWHDYIQDKELLSYEKTLYDSDIYRERSSIFKCINLLKKNYKDEHQNQLLDFFALLKKNLKELSSPDIKRVTVNKFYDLKLSYETYGDLLFDELPVDQKRIVIMAFYLTLFQTGLHRNGLNPSFLLLSLPQDFEEERHRYTSRFRALADANTDNFQIIYI